MRVRLAKNIFDLFTKEGRDASVSDLKRQGVDKVTLLGADQLAVLIEKSLDRALEHRVLELSEPEKAALLDRAQKEFETLRAELHGLEGETDKKRRELTDLESQLSGLHKDFASAGASLDAEIMAAARMDAARMPEPDIAVLYSVILQAGITNTAQAERAARAVVEYLRRERDAAEARAAIEHRARVELLERRLAKLNETLARTEFELEHALQNSNREEGMASIFKTVQGLRESAKDFERKRALLSELFQKNLVLQKGAASR
ncbi:MAG: hypothetical protein HY286_07445 [Planctomycetes bacterium]|nr:hypothetical protein [Planctomycetota bacterium]